MYEGGIRVPMIAWWPGTVPAGATCELPCAFWDFMPTFAEMAGVACPQTDGISILCALKGSYSAQTRHDYFYWKRAGEQVARADDWKGIHTAKTGKLERYNLRTDPAEANEMGRAKPEVAQRIQAILKETHMDDPRYPLIGKAKKAGNGDDEE